MGLLKLKTLKELDIDFNFITDLNPLTQLENLYKLKANNNRIVTLKPLMKLPKL
jgi:Leucine-rich repeat (LRR) protein